MFKIIRKKVYEDLVKDNKKLNTELDNKIEYLKCLLDQIEKLNKEIDNLKKDLKQENNNSISLQRQISSLIDTNKQLNNWVSKILDDVGIKELHERTGVTIPVYIQKDRPAAVDNFINEGYLNRTEIIIPELRFIKIGGKH